MLSEFRTLLKIIMCAMLMNPMYHLNHLIPSSDPKQPAFGRRLPSQKFCIVPFWLVGRPSAGVLLPQKFCIVPFWLVGRPLAGVLLPKNFVLFPSGLLAGLRPESSFPKIFIGPPLCPKFARLLKFSLRFPVKSLCEPRSRAAAEIQCINMAFLRNCGCICTKDLETK